VTVDAAERLHARFGAAHTSYNSSAAYCWRSLVVAVRWLLAGGRVLVSLLVRLLSTRGLGDVGHVVACLVGLLLPLVVLYMPPIVVAAASAAACMVVN